MLQSKITPKKILITGASGFIGYNACEYFLKNFWKVFGLSEKGEFPPYVEPVKVDLLDFKKLKKEIKKINPSIVLHSAAYVVLERDFEVARKCLDVNIMGTLNLLESVRKLPSLKKFIFFSTEEVYGDNKPPYKETQKVHPPSPYSISKVAGENLCLLYYKLYDLPVVILRLATVFGYYQPTYRFIPNIIMKAINNEPILLNSGKNKRDYLFIDDVIKAVDKAIISRKAIGEIFNIGHENPISGKTLAQKIVKLANSKSEIILNYFPDRKEEAKLWSMDSKKAEDILGWKANKSIDENIKKTINFYKKIKNQ